MELRQLEHFLGVIDHGGLGRAAEHLFLSQASLSASVRALERELKVSLFHRTGRRLVPTSVGAELAPLARRVLTDVVRLEDRARRAREIDGGVLTAVCTPEMSGEAVSSWASGFTKKYPAVRLDITEVGSTPELMAAVADGRAELGFTLERELRSDLRFIGLGVQRLLLVRPQASARPGPLPLREIDDLPLVLRHLTDPDEDEVHSALVRNGADPWIGATVPNRSAQLAFVLRSGFQTFLPMRMCVAALDAGAAVIETDPLIEAPFGVVCRAGPLAPAADQFVADFGDALGDWYSEIDHHLDTGLTLVEAVRAARDHAV